jgi:hypothetical protein
VAEEKTLAARLAELAKLFPPPTFTPAPGRPWQAAILARLQARRLEALSGALGQLPPPGVGGDIAALVNSFVTQYRTDSEQLAALVADYTQIEDRLAQFELAASDASGPTIAELYGKWQSSPYLKDPEIAAAVAALSTRAARVVALASANTAPEVLAGVRNLPAGAPEAVLAAWRRLTTPQVTWTADEPALPDLTTLAAAVQQVVAGNQQLAAARRAALQKALQQSLPAAWQKHAALLRTRPQLDAAFAALATFGLGPTDLTPPQRYDLALYRLAADAKNQPDDQLRSQINALTALVQSNNQLANAGTQWVTGEFAKLLAQKANATSKAGPELAGWTRDTAAPADAMSFTWPHDNQLARLDFVKLQVDGRGMYLCTTDVGTGLFGDVVAADNKAADVAGFLTKPRDMFSDSWRRTGPRGWRWEGDAIKPNGQWLYIDSQVTQPPYVWGNDISRAPGPDMPLQRISPAGALYFARLLGCRLPTSAEWTAAFDKFGRTPGAGVPHDAWNLRDQTWDQQRAHTASLNGTIDWPDDGIFVPSGVTAPTQADAVPWTRPALHAAFPGAISDGPGVYADGYGFFRPVHQANWPRFVPEDLVGNVAIYVLDNPDQVKALEKPGIALADARKVVVDSKSQLFVIGGSALSPPNVPLDKPQPLPPKVIGRADVAAQGFSDVGVRLAFSEPIESIPDGIARITAKADYLFAAR